jgi:bacterioferritin-associated ferredoxin
LAKTIICHCEDISLDDLYSALEQGYAEIESLKRFTGIGTGKCQGKCCVVQSLRVLNSDSGSAASAAGLSAGPGSPLEAPAEADPASMIHIPTIRQPVVPLKIDDIRSPEDTPHNETPTPDPRAEE